VPTKPAKSIRIRGDDNIGRMSDAQQSANGCSASAGPARPFPFTRASGGS